MAHIPLTQTEVLPTASLEAKPVYWRFVTKPQKSRLSQPLGEIRAVGCKILLSLEIYIYLYIYIGVIRPTEECFRVVCYCFFVCYNNRYLERLTRTGPKRLCIL